MKLKSFLGLALMSLIMLSGCQADTVEASEPTADDPTVIRMAHGIAEQSETGKEMAKIEPLIEEKSNGTIDMQIYGSGVLGSERDTIELVQAGVLDMAKVGASSLDAFQPLLGILSLPYMFENEDQLYDAMTDPKVMELINKSVEDLGFQVIGWYPSGARNFYTTKNDPIKTPDDLKGLKIRVMESATSTEMVKMMGASPVPMASSETYTAMQQGVIDGAENNELALTSNNHKEVAKNYSYTRHQMVPDLYLISNKTIDKLTDEQLKAIKDGIWENNQEYRKLNNQMLADVRKESEEAGMKFYDVDTEPFKEKVEPMHEEYQAKGKDYQELYDAMENAIKAGGH